MHSTSGKAGRKGFATHNAVHWCAGALALSLALACSSEERFEPSDPARGPGRFVGRPEPLNTQPFATEDDVIPAPRAVPPPPVGEIGQCDDACLAYCADAGLENPVNRALCPRVWGVGLATQPAVGDEACRRLFMDLTGRFPTLAEVQSQCAGRSFSAVAWDLLNSDEFIRTCRRRVSDAFRYNDQSVSVERIYDMDEIAEKLCTGRLSYDEFVTVASAHPVLTRRYATPGDIAEALFTTFLGRPPLGSERSDFARLYGLWFSGYYDHPDLGIRLPDAWIEYRCVDDKGNPDPATQGECASVLNGYHEVILKPDIRSEVQERALRMWSGVLKAEEWSVLQTPGRIVAALPLAWERAVDDVLEHYMGYEFGREVPAVREALTRYLSEFKGDIRAAHFAVVTSIAYLQSAAGGADADRRYLFGPLKQVEPEGWADTIKNAFGYEMASCDFRMTQPELYLDNPGVTTIALVENSEWELGSDGDIKRDYVDLVRNLGGCPVNDTGGRFKIISVLTTGVQTAFAFQVAGAGESDRPGAAAAALLPGGMAASTAIDADVAQQILAHQVGLLFGRDPNDAERDEAGKGAEECARQTCTAESFARALAFALLSSAELLFY